MTARPSRAARWGLGLSAAGLLAVVGLGGAVVALRRAFEVPGCVLRADYYEPQDFVVPECLDD